MASLGLKEKHVLLESSHTLFTATSSLANCKKHSFSDAEDVSEKLSIQVAQINNTATPGRDTPAENKNPRSTNLVPSPTKCFSCQPSQAET